MACAADEAILLLPGATGAGAAWHLQRALHGVRGAPYHPAMDVGEQDLRTAELLAVDTETNGRPGDACELTEVGAVLVGGGELHDRFASLVRVQAPLGRGIERFTGITQAMLDGAPAPEDVLAALAVRMEGRVLVAHSASFDQRVLRQAFDRAGVAWPDPPVLCTVALARRLLPLQRQRKLGLLAAALGIEVTAAHRALADAETCARVLCALFPRLCAHASTVAEAVALLAPRRRRAAGRPAARPAALPTLDFASLPQDPGVYVFRDALGSPLYVGKSVSLRTRARAHFAPAAAAAEWRAHAAAVDYRATHSELGALVLENRLIKALRPPGNVRLRRPDERWVYLRCRLDVAFPILEVATEPAAGELSEQLSSLFGLRHCGRRLPRREHPSAYGQMGRCLSPCLGDLDPNLYRRRLDAALGLFVAAEDGRAALLAHVAGQMRAAAAERAYERAAWLRRRLGRLEVLLGRLGGVLHATHAVPRLVLARHPVAPRFDAFWVIGGRVADWGPLPEARETAERTVAALARAGAPAPYAWVPRDELDEVRIVAGWLGAHADAATLPLDPAPDRAAVASFLGEATAKRLAASRRAPLSEHTPYVEA